MNLNYFKVIFMHKKRVLTGIKPTGQPHLGNYIGAIRPSIEMSHNTDYENFYFLPNYHGIITIFNPKEIKDFTYEMAASWLALGLNLDNAIFFKQSDIPEIIEITWILACSTSKGLMNRAHAYKAFVDKNRANQKDEDEGVNMGLYNYPILMAADILTFNVDYVPVGTDQLQHIELARDIAGVFNKRYNGEIIKLPKSITPPEGHVLPGTDGRKMSKSYKNTIPLFLPENKLRKSIMKIVTDSTGPTDPKDPNESNLFEIYKAFANPIQVSEMKERFLKGVSWGEVKQALFETVNEAVKDSRKRYEELMNDRAEIDRILDLGKNKARESASQFLTKIKSKIGVI